MNGSKSLDAPEFLQPDPETEKDYNAYLDEMAAAYMRINDADHDCARDDYARVTSTVDRDGGTIIHIEPLCQRVATASRTQGNGKSTRCAAVLRILADGQYHPTGDFLGPNVGGSEGMRRLRELRQAGYRIERRKIAGRSSWEYKLIL